MSHLLKGSAYRCTLSETANNFPFMYAQRRFSQASHLISTKYFQNRIIMFCLQLWFSVEKYEITILQEIHISILELHRWPVEFVISFSPMQYIFGMWDWGLAYSFWDHVIQKSLLEGWTFRIYFPNYESSNLFVATFTPIMNTSEEQ